MEKRHFNRKTIKNLKKEESGTSLNTVNTDKDILDEAKYFYQKLYISSKPNHELHNETFFPAQPNYTILSEEQKESCERETTREKNACRH